MKWIEIAKAKPKFGELYLIFGEDLAQPVLGCLNESTQTQTGLWHKFSYIDSSGDNQLVEFSNKMGHIAVVSLPNQKEVANG